MMIILPSPINLMQLTTDINAAEGLRLYPYVDTTGHVTIGYGTNLSAGITEAEANFLRDNRIAAAISQAEAQPWWPDVKDCEPRARAFVEIIFNMGVANFQGFTLALSAAERNDWDTCAAQLLNSKWATQVGKRAEELAEMVKTGNEVSVT